MTTETIDSDETLDLESDEQPTDPTASTQESSTGLESNVAGALAYVFGFLSGLVFYLLEPEDEFVRFHAAQSMVVSATLAVFYVFVTVFSTVLSAFSVGVGSSLLFGLVSLVVLLASLAVSVVTFALWLFLLVRTYQGETTRVPVVAGLADRIA